jgi:hypothetical protein
MVVCASGITHGEYAETMMLIHRKKDGQNSKER